MAAPVITIEVGAIDDVLERIGAAGGSVVQARTAIPGMGAFAYFTDTEGNVMGALGDRLGLAARSADDTPGPPQ